MSFNIRVASANDGDNDWIHRREQVVSVIRRSGADIVGFQEVQGVQLDWLRRRLPGFEFLARSREADDPAGESIPIFYRAVAWRIDPQRSGTFWLSDTPSVPGSTTWGNRLPRIVTWCRLVHADTGAGLYVFNVHLDHESENARLRSAQFLRQRLQSLVRGEPVVVLGDFNAEPSSAVIRTLTESPGGLVDVLHAAQADPAGGGTFHRFEGDRSGPAIDYIFVRPQMAVLDAGVVHDNVDGAYPSDHFPVVASIGLPAAPGNDEQREIGSQ